MALRQMGIINPVAEVLAQALSSDPGERFATVSDFACAFTRASRRSVSRKTAQAVVALVGSIALLVASVSVIAGRDNPVNAVIVAMVQAIPGISNSQPLNTEVEVLQRNVLSLTAQLNDLQNTLRREVIESRIVLRTRAQAIDLAETDAELSDADARFEEANLEFQRLSALRDVANPDIFNNPETLNAVNLIGLATDHIAEGRPDDGRIVLARAEKILVEKLRDYAQAKAIVNERFLTGNALTSDSGTAKLVSPSESLRRDWQSAIQSRRRFASEMQARMVQIPGGTYEMGDATGQGNQTEQPVRVVLVPAFQLSAFEVTMAEFQHCISDGACSARALNLEYQSNEIPVTGVSWNDTQDYLTWISRKTGHEYRLPTEAEWEYAAKAGAESAYPWGPKAGRGQANCVNCGSAWERIGPAPVASFAPNAFGLYDMSGNVWEWTADCWYSSYVGAPAIATARQENALCA